MLIFVVFVVLIAAPCFAKWISLSEHINEKCIQGTFHFFFHANFTYIYLNWGAIPQFVLWVNFFLPTGIWFPFVADIYIVSRVVKGHAKAYRTGKMFHLDDELFSLQRTFALREVQMESVMFTTVFLKTWKYCLIKRSQEKFFKRNEKFRSNILHWQRTFYQLSLPGNIAFWFSTLFQMLFVWASTGTFPAGTLLFKRYSLREPHPSVGCHIRPLACASSTSIAIIGAKGIFQFRFRSDTSISPWNIYRWRKPDSKQFEFHLECN